MTGGIERRGWAAWVLAGCLLPSVAGCHHRQPQQPIVLPQATPVPLANEPASPPLLTEPPKPTLPEVPVAEAATKPKRLRKKNKTPAATTTATNPLTPPISAPSSGAAAASSAPPTTEAGAATAAGVRESNAIGALTVGGEQDSKTKQEAAELIAANERRLNALSAEIARAQAVLVAKVRNFQRDAQQALGSGDVEGARTLATKGKLLLDDLEKSGS